jgi:heme/copper-type cytochrome/quinol oxidase subunit 3
LKNRVFIGMILFVASEAIFFLMLVLAYVSFHKVTGAQAAALLDPIKTGMFSVALFSSSFTMWLAEKAHEKGAATSVQLWLFATIALGVIFIGGQGWEYARLLMDDITISRDLFGSTFFTLTGFHGLHVLVGLCLLMLLFGLSVWGRKKEPQHDGMQSVAIYWHFVDAVWVVVFSVVYLWRYV